MRTSIILPVLLGAGAIAHPHFKLNNPLAHVHHKRQAPATVTTMVEGNEVVVEDIFVSTVYGNAPVPATTPITSPVVVAPEALAVAPVAQAPTTTPAPVQVKQDYTVPKQQEQQKQAAPVVSTPAAAPVQVQSSTPPASTPTASTASTGSSNDGAPVSGGKSILESANHYRSLMGFSTLTYDSTLGGNAAKTNNDDGANTMTHELNPGSMAQCIAQVDNNTGSGSFSPFDLTYLGWLCEIPDSRLGSDCQTMLTATNMQINYGDPGHAQILRSTSYSKMGCNYLTSTETHANFAGMWTCDFA